MFCARPYECIDGNEWFWGGLAEHNADDGIMRLHDGHGYGGVHNGT